MNRKNSVLANASKKHKKPHFNSCVKCLRSKKKGHNISLHKKYLLPRTNIYSPVIRFPKDPIRRAAWLTNCNFVEKQIECNRMLCSFHFEKDSIVQHKSKRLLKKSAVPVIFDKIKQNKSDKKQSQSYQSLQKTVDWSAIENNDCKVYLILIPITWVKPTAKNLVPRTYTQDIQTSGLSETILQKKVEDLENPAADVIPKSVLRQFTDQLSGYSLDPEKNDGINGFPIFPENNY